jgi:D-serine deaminase-like pyridoxal phosphate-dependent protein
MRGVLCHAGSTYGARGAEQVAAVHRRALGRLEKALTSLGAAGGGLEVSWGDTPSCRIAGDFGPATELRPGNYVFFDMMQLQIGSCGPGDMAVAVVCPVISSPAEDRAVVHCGAVHLSKEYLTLNGSRIYGALAPLEGGPPYEPDHSLPLVSLSQEHGVVCGPGAGLLRPGDLVSVVPVHSCLACDLYGGYLLEDGSRVARRASCADGAG